MAIVLEKGEGIDLTKGSELEKIRIGIGWYNSSVRVSQVKKEVIETRKKQGFLSTLGSLLKGEARIGDVVNSAVDGTKSVVNGIADEFDISPRNDFSYSGNIDIDTSIVCLRGGRFENEQDLVSYRKLRHSSGAIVHHGDNTSGKSSFESEEKDSEIITIDLKRIPRDIDALMIITNIFNCEYKKQHFGMIAGAWIKIYNDETNEELCRYNLTEGYNGYTGIEIGKVYRYKDEWKFKALGDPNKTTSIDSMLRYYR